MNSTIQRHLFIVICLIFIAFGAVAQVHPNLERGYAPDKAYAFGDIDDVNLFNGNLTVTLPLGLPRTISNSLSVGLQLSYNSKVWDTAKLVLGEPTSETHRYRVRPDRLGNAGFGWLVSMGRLIGDEEDDINTGEARAYQSPDGAVHTFSNRLHPSDTPTENVWYTNDGTYLRMRYLFPQYVVEFPDGAVQYFESWTDGPLTRWRLVKTRDAYGNNYVVDYSVANQWIIRDQYNRQIVVAFANTPAPPSTRPFDHSAFATAVDTITLTGFGGATAQYKFLYETRAVRRGTCGLSEQDQDDRFLSLPLLKTVTLRHGSTIVAEYQADYDLSLQPDTIGTTAQSCKAGMLTSLKLPTQATLRWTYGTYLTPSDCRGELISDKSAGVIARTLEVPSSGEFSGDVGGTWTYTPHLTVEPGSGYQCGTTFFPGTPPPVEMTQTVEDPDHNQTIHYFSVWKIGLQPGPNGATHKDFGLPFTRKTTSPNDPALFLSSRSCEGSCSNSSNIKRSTYVSYERDFNSFQNYDANRRLIASETVFEDDGQRSVRTTYANNDGVGHFRLVAVIDRVGPNIVTKMTETNYNLNDPLVGGSMLDTGTYSSINGTGFTLPSTTLPWILNTYSRITSTQTASTHSKSSVTTQYACFDRLTGVLRGTRVAFDPSGGPNSHDLLSLFQYSNDIGVTGGAEGFVTSERYYGGDHAPLTQGVTTPLCTLATTDTAAPLQYRVDHTYKFGSRETSKQYTSAGAALTFKVVDLTIDSNTGFPSAVRDTAGVSVTYQFDASGRLTTISPAGLAPISYSYLRAGATTRAKVIVQQNSTSGLVKNEMHIDSLGRVALERKTLDGSVMSNRTTEYDSLGRKKAVTDWGSNAPTQFRDYDNFGRAHTIIGPDGSMVWIDYTGQREITRTQEYARPGGTAEKSITERYDGFGRLIQVFENAGPTTAASWQGSTVTTSYQYDVGDRLTSVSMSPPSGTVQTRTFNYDPRGLLSDEQQAEYNGGTMRYAYDAKGHVRTRTVDGNPSLTTTFNYDAAERIFEVWTGVTPALRLTKTFGYGISGTAAGRLKTATRYNYLPSSWDYYSVAEEYVYDANGRVDTRETKIEKVVNGSSALIRTFTLDKSYNDLGLPSTIDYPTCASCGSPARSLTLGYQRGFLKSIQGFVDSISYDSNGMPARVDHTNQISDVISYAANGMPRPASIRFEGLCTMPAIVSEPSDKTVNYQDGAGLNVIVSGSATITYQWSRRFAGQSTWTTIVGATSSFLDVSVDQETYFRLTATNACGTVQSREIRVTIRPYITAQPQSTSISGGQTSQLSVVAGGTGTLTYRWYVGNTGDVSNPVALPNGANNPYTTPQLFATTRYWVRVSSSYGTTDSATATITVQLAAPTNVVASRLTNTSIRVTWTGVTGAGRYALERRAGSGFVHRAYITAGTTLFDDTTVQANMGYVYRVIAQDSSGGSASAASNEDLAVTIAFNTVAANQVISDDPLQQILTGVNALRLTFNGSATPYTWTQLVGTQIPSDNAVVYLSAISELRTRVNAARVALGFPNWTFSSTSPAVIKANHIVELQDAMR